MRTKKIFFVAIGIIITCFILPALFTLAIVLECCLGCFVLALASYLLVKNLRRYKRINHTVFILILTVLFAIMILLAMINAKAAFVGAVIGLLTGLLLF